MIVNYLAGADAILLCYDVTNQDSFLSVRDWYRVVSSSCVGPNQPPLILLVGNKGMSLLPPIVTSGVIMLYSKARARPYSMCK